MKGYTKPVRLDLIRIDGGTQPRMEINLEIVAEYAEAMKRGDEFPPVKLMFDGKDHWLWDGFHRYHAAKKDGNVLIQASISEGTKREAVLASFGANRTHGQRRSREDVRNSITQLLQDEEWGKRSDSWIAEQVGCDHKTVYSVRKELESTWEIPKLTERIGKDGKERSLPQRQPVPQAITIHAELPMVGGIAEAPPPKGQLGGYITLPDWQKMSEGDRQEAMSQENNGKTFNNQNDNENIEWALWSWNPVTGCEHNCPYCYARDIANRFYEQKFTPSLWPERLHAPVNTPFPEAKAKEWMGHKNVFTCSMADLFGRWVPKEWIDAVLDVVENAPQWNFLFLTKFPQRMAEFEFPDNAWVGTSIDCQARVDNAEKAFRKIKAKVKWLSCEPMLERLDFSDLSMFQWVVIGGSSRSAETPEWIPPKLWVAELEEQCASLGIPFYEKTNLLEKRIRMYPGDIPLKEKLPPKELVYLPQKGKK